MQKFYTFCIRFLQIISLILFGILAASSFLGTALIEEPYAYVIHLLFDNPLLNLLFLCCFLGIFHGLAVLFSCPKIHPIILLGLTCLWVFGACLLWIYFSKNGPIADGASVYYAARQFAGNDFSAVSYRDSYFSVYPFQYGLAFFYEMIFRLVRNDNFHILQGINALCLVLCTISQYHLCGLLFSWRSEDGPIGPADSKSPSRQAANCPDRRSPRLSACGKEKARIYTLLFTAFCAPFIMYSSFIYGEIPSITFTLFGTWMLFLFLDIPGQTETSGTALATQTGSPSRTARAFCGILACVFIPGSVLVRKNSLIFLIALGITAVLWLFQNKDRLSRKRLLLYTAYFVLLFSLSICILPAVQSRYAKRAGQEINSGVPASTYLAMGLSETEVGPGFYSAYNFDTFTVDADYDAEIAAELGRKAYRERLSYFAANPGYALSFFVRKFCVEWIDTGWAVFPATYNSLGERYPLVESLFSGALHAPFKKYINNYQMTLYLCAAVCTFALFRRKEKTNVFAYLFPLTAFGGALFFLAWEANGRYMLPYAIFMFPYAGYGAAQLAEQLEGRFIPFLKKRLKKAP